MNLSARWGVLSLGGFGKGPMLHVFKKHAWSFALVLLACWGGMEAAAQAPRLTARAAAAGRIEIRWPAEAANFQLEAAGALVPAPNWQPVTQATVTQGAERVVTLEASQVERYFRLGPAASVEYTRISESSPADGEIGVAVTRETVVHFSRPLAAETVLNTNHFYATSGVRRILSRIELASDRSQATLFYQEPLPGSARINVIFGGDGLRDDRGLPLDPAGTGTTNGFKLIQFETLSLTPLAGTAVTGRVFASELMPGPDTGTNAVNRPLEGVIITVDGREQELRAVTDAQGNFTLNPVPAGRFFVKVDGRPAIGSAYPNGAYYPYVGKAWDAVAGKTNNLAGGTGEIFLPLITAGTLQPVSLTQDTVISFPSSVVASNQALAGVTLTVPANALFSENGARGGRVGIAPVPPDRLPEPLPEGLELSIVITVQTDGGLNFDQPAPICFPNLPDPVLKTPLPAGSKQALISFNHDKGIWEAAGSMTVSADGKMICTDPGEGILQPGWHGVAPEPEIPVEPCKPSTQAMEECFKFCRAELEDCKRAAGLVKMGNDKICIERFESGIYNRNEFKQCFRQLYKGYKELLQRCAEQFAECSKNCLECFDPFPPKKDDEPEPEPEPEPPAENKASSFRGRISALGAPSLSEQIARLLEQATDLILPYADSEEEIPDAIFDQALALEQQAEALAGGNLVQFLQNEINRIEQGQAGQDAVPDRGNAPVYPVFYAAEILRPNGPFYLRGETGPLGEYSLFVPRDGTLVKVVFHDPRTRSMAIIQPYKRPEVRFDLPRLTLAPIDASQPDGDADQLPDVIELVYGTDPADPDSDEDGIFDGAEVNQGTNPLDGVPVRTGIVGTARTRGAAVDVAAGNDLLAVAEGASGISVYSIVDGTSPVLVAQLGGLGNVQRVALSGNYAAAVAGDAGLHIISLEGPAAPAVFRHFRRPVVQAAAIDGGVAYAAYASGAVAALDLASGLPRAEIALDSPAWDLALHGDHLYALSDNRLSVISLAEGRMALAGAIEVLWEITPNRRILVGGGIAYTVQGRGYSTVDVSDPARPVLLARAATAQFGWNHLAATGSGLGVAAVGPNPNAPADIALYDLSSPRTNNLFLTQITTPGTASVVSIFKGLAYVADGGEGIQIINYLPFDRNGQPPILSVATSAAGGVVESGAPVRVTANATDDAQVRQVEFYVDGQLAFTDGNFPFEHRFEAPALTAARTNLTLRARAFDTGGNATLSEELRLQLTSDATPPQVAASTPLGGGSSVRSLTAHFNEPMNPASLSAGSVRVIAAGADGLFDTADDFAVNGGAVQYLAESAGVSLTFATALPAGLYRGVVAGTAADTAGNQLGRDYTWQIRAANAVFWTNSTDGFWEDGLNWSTGSVPGPTDDIFIESIPGGVTITARGGAREIKRLVAGERVVVNGANWQIVEKIELLQPLILSQTTLKGGTVQQSADGKLIFSPGSQNTLDGVRVESDLSIAGARTQTFIRNGLSLAGNLILSDLGAFTFAGNQTFDHSEIILRGNGQLALTPGTTLTLGPGVVVRGAAGTVGTGEFGVRKLINQGLISADAAVPGNTLTVFATHFENAGTLECKNGGAVTILEGETKNTGTIRATGGGTMTIQGAWNNTGTITVDEGTLNLGGTFRLADLGTVNRTGGTVNLTGVLDLAGGTLALNARSGSWGMKGGTLKNGKVEHTEVAKLLINSASTLEGMQVAGDLELTGATSHVLIRNRLILSGRAILDGGSITFAGDQTFDDTEVFYRGHGQLAIAPGTTLTLGPALIVRGAFGTVGGGNFGVRRLINRGLILADAPGGNMTLGATHFENAGTLESKNGGAVLILEGETKNTGAIRASGGGTMTLQGAWSNAGTMTVDEGTLNLSGTFRLADLGTLNRTGGTVNLTGVLDLAGGTLALNARSGSWGMRGGTLKNGKVEQTEGAKLLFVAPNNSGTFNSGTFDGLQVVGDLELTGFSARALIRNGLILNGRVILDNASFITFAGDQTFDHSEVFFRGGASLAITPGTTLTLGPGMVVRGASGNVGGVDFGVRKLINRGLIAAEAPGGTLSVFPTDFENSGTLRADGAGSRLVVNVTPFNNTGTIQELNGGRVVINP